jgi:hypothetical protein
MMDPSFRGLRNALAYIIPNWLANRVDFQVGYKILYTVALIGDQMIESALESVRASWPGKGTPTALPLIGQSRGLIRGRTDTDDVYAGYLVDWLTTWENAGADQQVVTEIRNYLGGDPTVTLVDRAGHWTTINPDRSITQVTAAWDWDSISGFDKYSAALIHDTDNPWWSDQWIIVYPPPWAVQTTYTGPSDGNEGIGLQNTQQDVDAIASILGSFKGAHTFIRAIIWSFDPTKFIPTNPTADGNYGNWFKIVAGVAVPSRDASARYTEPRLGGG